MWRGWGGRCVGVSVGGGGGRCVGVGDGRREREMCRCG